MGKMSLIERTLKNSTIKTTGVLSETKFFEGKDVITTPIYSLNIALSGSLHGGFKGGVGIISGKSKSFKTSIMLLMVSAFLKKHKDGIALVYDSEFGAPPEFWKAFDIDMERVIHSPITSIEELRTDIVNQINEFDASDKVMICVDSLGNIGSLKELNDALDGKDKADFTKSKQMKSLFRLITQNLSIKDIPFVAIAHTYETMEMYSQSVISGGTGLMYAADWAVIIGKQQEKEGTDLVGYNFILNIEKSRMVREKSKIPLSVKFDGGISKWSGLLDIALESGHVSKVQVGWYSRVNTETGEVEDKKWRAKDTNSSEFWEPIISDESFNKWITRRYKIANATMVQEYGDDSLEEESLTE